MPFSVNNYENRTARIWMDCRGSGPGAQASAKFFFYDLTHFRLFNVINSHRIALCVLYPFLQLLLYLIFQGKELERFVFVLILRATELQISSAKNTFLLLLSFSRYSTRSLLTMMAGMGVAHKVLKKKKKRKR